MTTATGDGFPFTKTQLFYEASFLCVATHLIILHRLHLTSTRLYYSAVEEIYSWLNIQPH